MGRRTPIEHMLDRMRGAERVAEPRKTIVTHPLNLPGLAALFPPGLEKRPQTLAMMLSAVEVVPSELVPRWATSWEPPDWGPLWQLGPEDEASLRPAGFGRMVEHVGKPAFFLMERPFPVRHG